MKRALWFVVLAACGTDRGNIARRSRADHNHIKVFCHVKSLLFDVIAREALFPEAISCKSRIASSPKGFLAITIYNSYFTRFHT